MLWNSEYTVLTHFKTKKWINTIPRRTLAEKLHQWFNRISSYIKNPPKVNGDNKARKSQLVIVVHLFLRQICIQIIIINERGISKGWTLGLFLNPEVPSVYELESRLLNLQGIVLEQAFSQDFRSSASGRMRPTARKAFLVSGTRRAEVSKMKNNGEKKVS